MNVLEQVATGQQEMKFQGHTDEVLDIALVGWKKKHSKPKIKKAKNTLPPVAA